jgi:putative endonuclease
MFLMKYVYLIQSISHPKEKYIGITSDFKDRLKSHNDGQCPHTAKLKPLRIKTAVAFTDQKKALDFETYLKSPSGRSFAKKRL